MSCSLYDYLLRLFSFSPESDVDALPNLKLEFLLEPLRALYAAHTARRAFSYDGTAPCCSCCIPSAASRRVGRLGERERSLIDSLFRPLLR